MLSQTTQSFASGLGIDPLLRDDILALVATLEGAIDAGERRRCVDGVDEGVLGVLVEAARAHEQAQEVSVACTDETSEDTGVLARSIAAEPLRSAGWEEAAGRGPVPARGPE